MIQDNSPTGNHARTGTAAPANKGASEAGSQQQGAGPITTDSLSRSILASLTNQELPVTPPAETHQTESSGGTAQGAADAPHGDQPDDDSLTQQQQGEEHEQAQAPEGESEGEGDELHSDERKEWSKSAIDTVTGLRKSKRELKEKLAAAERTAKELQEKLQQQGEPGKQQTPVPQAGGQHPDKAVREVVAAEVQVRQNIYIASSLLEELEDQGAEVVIERFQNAGLKPPGTDERSIRRELSRMVTGYQTQLASVGAAKQAALATYQSKLDAERTQQTTEAAKKYPWLNDPKAAEQKAAAELKARFPGITNLPDGDLIVARYVAVVMAEQGAAKAKPTTPAPKPTKLPGAAPRIPATPSGAPNTQALLKKYQETGDPNDKAAWLKATIGSVPAS